MLFKFDERKFWIQKLEKSLFDWHLVCEVGTFKAEIQLLMATSIFRIKFFFYFILTNRKLGLRYIGGCASSFFESFNLKNVKKFFGFAR